ncbi:type VII secretion-associated serine protease mycosin [Mycobacterium sp. 852013-51886_SCH5428379]|uniref:type VII secretion-associated serine protease mycosin n=1 Tax=Mycobacterium sp. 852013-51886_SCH5428379 TaxID=1834111 RepID=UPI0007FBE371|nr:type VII secretion-associated serine protease mycosin [Mycobacterium sp. 852013-51886_SCH5428379]OBB57283.1 type VII secretion-associated serine protease mycosin [Mycobacterium sp. 852013-51886_SCH5428379]
MTPAGRFLAGAAATALVAVTPIATAPPAAAVTPPPPDDAFLPAAIPPAPPQATEQREPCVAGSSHAAPTDPAAAQLNMLDLPAVWPLTRGAGQTVAVIDTGVARHRLLGRLLPGGDYVSSGDGTDDCDGHGTVVAGIIGTRGAFSGIAPEAAILAIRQSSNRFGAVEDPAVSGYGDVHTLALAVRLAADLGATVINVSSVACVAAADTLDDRALGAALAYAVDVKNVVVVAAAGNVGGSGQCPEQNPVTPGRPDWQRVAAVASPAWYDDLVLTVGSVDRDGAASTFSLAGPWVDVAAPGEGVISLDPDGEGLVDRQFEDDEKPIAGTSYAAPVVSGLVALVRSRWPQLSARQVMARIEATAHRPPAGWDPVVGNGIVDVVAAVSGGAEPAPVAHPERRFGAPPAEVADPRPRRVAVAGAGLGVAAAILIAATTSGRRRGGGDTRNGVADD